jgi:hypothetical protein
MVKLPPKNSRPIKTLDLAILLYHVWRGSQEPEIGHADAKESLTTLTNQLNRKVYLDPALIESALWSANMLDEDGKFWHPHGLTFDEWVRNMLGSRKEYNRNYGTIEKSNK